MVRRMAVLVFAVLAGASARPGVVHAQDGLTGLTPDREAQLVRAFGADAWPAVREEIAAAAARGAPTEPLVIKAMEGATKRAPVDRVRAAVRALGERLVTAQQALARARGDDEVTAGAVALQQGAAPRTLKQLRTAWPDKSLEVPLGLLAELYSRGVPRDRATEHVLTLMRKGATSAQLAEFGRKVQDDIAAGQAPSVALDIRSRGVLSLLPQAPALSAQPTRP
jgi:hypothetical protein